MNIPLSWLAEYVDLPKSVDDLTDKFTMVGHMLNKKWITGNGETVIDLELRGNRSDLFGIIGIAREVCAINGATLRLPPTCKLPESDTKSALISVEADDLVERFLGFKMHVNVGQSPKWLIKNLRDYGLPSINNVVDITNFVMIETGEPMHAYDTASLKGETLILRRAKNREDFTTLLGTKLILSNEDLVIADAEKPVGLTMIGGQNSGVSEKTNEIILEAAVYNQANVRRSARKLNVFTEAGTRHEKHLDPNQVELALQRALYLLTEYADAKPIGMACDYYPKEKKPKQIIFILSETQRLTGTHLVTNTQIKILESLGCKTKTSKDAHELEVTIPTFRTDIEQSADLVEEIIRIHGYEKIPVQLLDGLLPCNQTTPILAFTEKIKDFLVNLSLNEVITSPIVNTNSNDIKISNAPDPTNASLRSSLLPNLFAYGKKNLDFNQERIALFEIGKIYYSKDETYVEENRLGIVLGGQTDTLSWNKKLRMLTYYDLKGVIESLYEKFAIQSPVGQLQCQIHKEIFLFAYEIPLETLFKNSTETYVAKLVPAYPSIIEDFSFEVSPNTQTDALIKSLKNLSSIIKTVVLLDSFENSRTIRVEFMDQTKSLTATAIQPLRNQLINLAKEKFSAMIRADAKN